MNLAIKGIIIAIMELKLSFIAKVVLTATMLLTQTAFADNAKEPSISGKPYQNRGPLNTNLPNPSVDSNLPDLGDIAQTVLTPQDEQRIAEQILREVAVSDDVLQDAEITDYLQAVGQRLAASGPDKRQVFNFFVVRDNSINAFAMPGGVIGVHTGLILASNSESEMASVLGLGISSGVTRRGPRGAKVSKNFPRHHCPPPSLI